ncbi:MAG: TatD family hydrolase [Alphaproteobacteria bacterium]
MWIDSHCHLNHEKLAALGSVDAIVDNARSAGVDGMLSICCRIESEFPHILSMVKKYEKVWCTIGTHPHEASRPDEKAVSVEKLVSLANSDPKIIGIGESGLDYYYNHSTREDQQASFRKHIRACVETDLPIVVHARDADEDIIRIIREEGRGKLRGVMHCFSSGTKMAEEALELGFYISFSGILTFKQAQNLRDIAAKVPLDRVLVETDAPYLAPEPHRGKTNQPSFVVHTGRKLAEVYRISEEKMAADSKANFFRLFSRAAP